MKASARIPVVAAALAALLLSPLARPADALSVQARADQARALPVKTSIEKGQPGPQYGAPYVLTVTNTGQSELKLKAVVAQSVIGHNRPKSRELPEQVLAAGASWRIDDLAVEDKVALSAAGYESLEVRIPSAK